MVGIPTFFITRKYGRNLKKDWILFLIPLVIWPMIMGVIFGENTDMVKLLAQNLVYTAIGGTVGYFVFRQHKKKIPTEK